MAAKRKRHSPEFKTRGDRGAQGHEDEPGDRARVRDPPDASGPMEEPATRSGRMSYSAQARPAPPAKEREQELSQTYEQIGRLNMEIAWLKKVAPSSE